MSEEKNTPQVDESIQKKADESMLDMAELEYNRYLGNEEEDIFNAEGYAEQINEESKKKAKQSVSGGKSIADAYVLSLVIGFVLGVVAGFLSDSIPLCLVCGIIVGCVVGTVITYFKHGNELKENKDGQPDEN